MRACLERGDERIAASEPQIVLAGGFAVWTDRIAPIDDRGQFAWIVAERAAQPMTLSPGDTDEVIEALLGVPRPPRLHLPAEYAVPEVSVPGRPFVRRGIPGLRRLLGIARRVPWREGGRRARSVAEMSSPPDSSGLPATEDRSDFGREAWRGLRLRGRSGLFRTRPPARRPGVPSRRALRAPP